ncbi:MAG: transcriptional repressor [Kosmotoga sp.]|uniref:Fur family transcriptional regulator n=1 Tax=Kosmotoga sp. TaxID=1955248 RepID=UPI001D213DF6|nr:Fur family transcriptional regulator [Kosmotoga sp.]MBO8166253.1 transcriptional repressor [Kosmotoga sp.]
MHVKEAIDLLKSKGYRITPQRIAILKVLENNKEHPSAEDIFLQARKYSTFISFASIYNILDILEKEGLIKSIFGIDGIKHYDPDTSCHAHFFCKKCGRLLDLKDNFIELSRFKESLSRYDVESVEVIVTGICPDCKKEL